MPTTHRRLFTDRDASRLERVYQNFCHTLPTDTELTVEKKTYVDNTGQNLIYSIKVRYTHSEPNSQLT